MPPRYGLQGEKPHHKFQLQLGETQCLLDPSVQHALDDDTSRELNRGDPRVLVHGSASAWKVEGHPETGVVGFARLCPV